jgi:hypothetical protein
VGGPIQYRWMYHIERALKYLKPMVDNGARVEGCIDEAFILKEVAYFSSVYFTDEHNDNTSMMRYSVNKEPPCSLSIFTSRGTTVGSSTSYYFTSKERNVALLYMYANIDGVDKYFK